MVALLEQFRVGTRFYSPLPQVVPSLSLRLFEDDHSGQHFLMGDILSSMAPVLAHPVTNHDEKSKKVGLENEKTTVKELFTSCKLL